MPELSQGIRYISSVKFLMLQTMVGLPVWPPYSIIKMGFTLKNTTFILGFIWWDFFIITLTKNSSTESCGMTSKYQNKNGSKLVTIRNGSTQQISLY